MLKSIAGKAAKQKQILAQSVSTVVLEAEDHMDDGSSIRLRLSIDGEKGEATFDFEGTSSEVRTCSMLLHADQVLRRKLVCVQSVSIAYVQSLFAGLWKLECTGGSDCCCYHLLLALSGTL